MPAAARKPIPSESEVNKEILQISQARKDIRLWRNNRGMAKIHGHRVRYGVGPNGAADWLGYRVVFITEEMVGTRIAQFLAVEAKRQGEAPEEEQQRFIDSVNADGGCAGVATCGEQAMQVMDLIP